MPRTAPEWRIKKGGERWTLAEKIWLSPPQFSRVHSVNEYGSDKDLRISSGEENLAVQEQRGGVAEAR